MMPTVILKNAFVHPPQICMGTGHKCHRMDGSPKSSESHTVGIMGIWVHCPVHVGSRLLSTGDSFGEVSRALLDGHINGFIYHLLIAL